MGDGRSIFRSAKTFKALEEGCILSWSFPPRGLRLFRATQAFISLMALFPTIMTQDSATVLRGAALSLNAVPRLVQHGLRAKELSRNQYEQANGQYFCSSAHRLAVPHLADPDTFVFIESLSALLGPKHAKLGPSHLDIRSCTRAFLT